MKSLTNKILAPFNLAVLRWSTLEDIQKRLGALQEESKSLDELEKHRHDLEKRLRKSRRALAARERDANFLSALPDDAIAPALRLLGASKAQIRQDIFALVETGFMRNGYFVEFGAADGVHLSNTHLLEKEFGWSGILAEPGKQWHSGLRANRPEAIVETDCVWSRTGDEVEFAEAGTLSTVRSFAASDSHASARAKAKSYRVRTLSLLDMLKRHNAPKDIDFLSIDTEGTEFEILNAFDFDAHTFRVICCEHNHTPQRERIYELLTSKGYRRKLDSVSRVDDWYVRER